MSTLITIAILAVGYILVKLAKEFGTKTKREFRKYKVVDAGELRGNPYHMCRALREKYGYAEDEALYIMVTEHGVLFQHMLDGTRKD